MANAGIVNKKIHSLALLVNLGIYGIASTETDRSPVPQRYHYRYAASRTCRRLAFDITADKSNQLPAVSEVIRPVPGIN